MLLSESYTRLSQASAWDTLSQDVAVGHRLLGGKRPVTDLGFIDVSDSKRLKLSESANFDLDGILETSLLELNVPNPDSGTGSEKSIEHSDIGSDGVSDALSATAMAVDEQEEIKKTKKKKKKRIPIAEREVALDPNSDLVKAARGGDLERVKKLIAMNVVDVNYQTQSCSVLHYAAFYNRIEVVRSLIEGGASPNVRNLSGLTPLHWAIDNGKMELVSTLMDLGADPNVPDNDGLSVLHKAVLKQNHSAISYLIESELCDLEAVSSEANQSLTCLHIAATLGDMKTVIQLVRAGADVTARSTRGALPIHKAAVRGHHAIVQYLVNDAHSPLDCDDKSGRTPLHWATFYHRVDAVKELVALGASPLHFDRIGVTPLEIATRKNFQDLIVFLSKDLPSK